MRTEMSLIVGALFIGWGFYERLEARFPRDNSKSFDANLFIVVGALNVSAAVYSLFG